MLVNADLHLKTGCFFRILKNYTMSFIYMFLHSQWLQLTEKLFNGTLKAFPHFPALQAALMTGIYHGPLYEA